MKVSMRKENVIIHTFSMRKENGIIYTFYMKRKIVIFSQKKQRP